MSKQYIILFLLPLTVLLVGFRNNSAFMKTQQSKLGFTTSAQSVYTGACSGAATLQTQSASGSALNVGADLTVNLGTSGTMLFYSDSACVTPVTSVTVYAGYNTQNFYFMFSVNGSETITATATAYKSTTQVETSSTNPFIWTGGGGNANWTTNTNWSGGLAPGAGSQAIFDSSCVSNCSATINSSISIAGLRMKTGYAGTITQGAGSSVTVGAAGWAQSAGSFVGGSSTITTNGDFSVTGGSMTSTSGNFDVKANFALAGATFSHNSGTVSFSGGAQVISANGFSFNNMLLYSVAWASKTLSGGTLNINGTLTLDSFSGCGGYCSVDNGTLSAKGNIVINNDGMMGSGLILVSGSSNQTIDGSAVTSAAHLPNLQIASTGGVVSFLGNVGIGRNYTFTSGTLNAGTSNLIFNMGDQNITPGAATYYNVTISSAGWNAKDLQGGVMTLSNNLLMSAFAGCGTWCSINNGTINVGGNITVTTGGYVGNAMINMTGTNNATYSVAAGQPVPAGSVIINKSASATVTLLSNLPLSSASQGLTITSGTLDLSSFTLSVNSAITIGTAGALICNGGTYTSGSLLNSGTVDCAGYGFNWTGNGANANWNTAANWAGGVVPNSTQVPVFKDTYCGAKCNATINVNPNVAGIRLLSPYGGTLTQTAGVAVTIGASCWQQASGTFAGNNSTITVNGNYSLTGGTFTSTTGSLVVLNSFTQNGGSTFNANGGTVQISGFSTLTTTSMSFANLWLNANYTTVTVNGTVSVSGALSYGSGCCGTSLIAGTAPATISVAGNITNNVANSYGGGGTVLIKVAGSGNQTITGNFGGSFPNFEIANTGGTVSLVGTISASNFTHTSGVVNAGTSTVVFYTSVTTNGMSFYNLTVGAYTPVLNGTVTVLGTFSISGGASSAVFLNAGTAPATVEAKGNIVLNSYSGYGGGSAKVRVSGGGNQTISSVDGFMPNFEIASTGGVVTFTGAIKFSRDFIYTGGTVAAAGSTLIFIPETGVSAITPGSSNNYNDVSFNFNGTYNLSGTFNVGGNLTLNAQSASTRLINGGTINVSGNTSVLNFGMGGTAAMTFSGAANSTISVAAGATIPGGLATLNKSFAATLSLASAASFNTLSQSMTLTSGILDLAGFGLTVNSALTIGASAALICNGGTYTAGSFSNSGAIDCSGYGFNWTGNGGNSNWNTGGNWAGGVAPNSTQVAIFKDSYCGANCTATINVDPNVRGIRLLSGYSGALTQSAGVSVTLGSGGYSQAGGTYNSNASTITCSGNWAVTGGTFNASTSTLVLSGSQLIPGTANYYNVTLNLPSSTFSTLTGTFSVVNLTLASASAYEGFNGGTINVTGNLNLQNYGAGTYGGSAVIAMTGNTNQSITATGVNAQVTNLTINSAGGTVSYSGTFTVGNYIVTAGTVAPGTSDLTILGGTLAVGTEHYNNVTIWTNDWTWATLSGTFYIDGTLTAKANFAALTGGTIQATGNVVLQTAGFGIYGNTTILKLAGSSSQSITATGGGSYIGNLLIASTGGLVSMSGPISVQNATSVLSGAVAETSAADMFATGTLSLAGNTLTRNGGTVKVGAVTVPGGSQSLYGGTIAP